MIVEIFLLIFFLCVIGVHNNDFAMKFKDIDDKATNNSSAAELEHKWQKKFHNICVLMEFEYGMLFLYNYGLFKIEYREIQLTKQHKSNKKMQWQAVGSW